jgi:hypothetical protein
MPAGGGVVAFDLSTPIEVVTRTQPNATPLLMPFGLLVPGTRLDRALAQLLPVLPLC